MYFFILLIIWCDSTNVQFHSVLTIHVYLFVLNDISKNCVLRFQRGTNLSPLSTNKYNVSTRRRSTLIIEDIRISDSGKYFIHATNWYDKAELTLFLSIKGKKSSLNDNYVIHLNDKTLFSISSFTKLWLLFCIVTTLPHQE